jgi:flagella basal body P-ring formation protein FlgA
MQRHTLVSVLVGLGMMPATPAFAQATGFADPAAIDAEIAAFTGAAAGAPGGARGPVDRRLRVAACGQPLQLAWHGRDAGMVRVECNGASPWRVFVAVNAAGATRSTPTAAPQIARGQVLTITLQGRGFAISQQAQALEAGRVGEWIRVRPEGSSEEVRARIDSPVRATIPLHG